MKIRVEGLGKKFNKDWIFRNLSCEFEQDKHTAILGPNGSGKSTLMQVLSGFITPSEGKISYFDFNNTEISVDAIFKELTFSSPYLELIEEFTLTELLKFHRNFKSFRGSISSDELIEISSLGTSAGKQIKYFSSGMKQRVRLSLAILSDAPIVFLDEPLTNLDKSGYTWYHELIEKYSHNRTIIVSSNHQKEEYDFCLRTIEIVDYK